MLGRKCLNLDRIFCNMSGMILQMKEKNGKTKDGGLESPFSYLSKSKDMLYVDAPTLRSIYGLLMVIGATASVLSIMICGIRIARAKKSQGLHEAKDSLTFKLVIIIILGSAVTIYGLVNSVAMSVA